MDWAALLTGVLGALIGGAASFWATARATKKANAQAYTDLVTGIGQSWVDSDNPELARIGAELVGSGFRAMADDPHVPDKIRAAVSRVGDLGSAVDQGRRLVQGGDDELVVVVDEEVNDDDEGTQGHA